MRPVGVLNFLRENINCKGSALAYYFANDLDGDKKELEISEINSYHAHIHTVLKVGVRRFTGWFTLYTAIV